MRGREGSVCVCVCVCVCVYRVLAKAVPRRGVKPANKVGAINYKEPVTYRRTVVRSYDRIRGTFYRN